MAYNRTLQHFTSSQELATVWASGQDYITNQIVVYNYTLYLCLIDHESSASFPNDFSDGKWAITGGGSGDSNRMVNLYAVNTTLSNLNSVVLVDATSGSVTITLPASVSGKYFDIKKIDTSVNTVIVTPTSGTIDGDPNVVISSPYASITIVGDGVNFYVL